MLRYICVAMIVISVAFRVANQIKVDLVGRPAKLPRPASEHAKLVVLSVLAGFTLIGVFYGAGLFDGLFR